MKPSFLIYTTEEGGEFQVETDQDGKKFLGLLLSEEERKKFWSDVHRKEVSPAYALSVAILDDYDFILKGRRGK